jgi:hypothetical protein
MGTRKVMRLRSFKDQLISHRVNEDLLAGIQPRVNLPIKKISDGMIICFADVDTDRFYGKAVLFQEPIPGMTAHDWREPQHHGITVSNGFIAYYHCCRVNQCDCLFTMLGKHFDRFGLTHYGWEPIKDTRGEYSGLMIVAA